VEASRFGREVCDFRQTLLTNVTENWILLLVFYGRRRCLSPQSQLRESGANDAYRKCLSTTNPREGAGFLFVRQSQCDQSCALNRAADADIVSCASECSVCGGTAVLAVDFGSVGATRGVAQGEATPRPYTGGTPVLRPRRGEAGVLRVQRALLIADMANLVMSARPAISLCGAGFAWRVEQLPTPALYPTGTSA
jgi:hypothetical protein